jgi:hypothetical protein
LTATAYPTPGYVLVQADWSDVPEVAYAAVTRRNTVTGDVVTLRPHLAYDADGNQLLNCGIGIWWDTDPPLNVPLEYCTTAADVPTVLNSNPGFETGTVPWVAAGGALTQSALNVKTGSFSGRFVSDGSGFMVATVYTNTDTYVLQGGVSTTVGMWALATTGWNGVAIAWNGFDEDGFFVEFQSPWEILDANEYRYISVTFTHPVDVTVQNVNIIMAGPPPNLTTFHFDDVQVTQLLPVSTTACDTVTVTTASLFLKNPLHPCLDLALDLCDPAYSECAEDTVRVSYAGHEEDEFNANTSLLFPVNRRRPVPVNRERRDATSTLRLITHDCAARDAVLETNEPGDPLLFQDGSGDYCIEDRYMSVATVTVRRIGVDQRDEFRLIELPYTVVDRPEGPADGPCGTRFEDLCDLYTSWGALEISDLDWIDLPTGGASNDSPSNPLPVAARTWDDVEAEFTDWDDVAAGGTRDWDELRDGL